jgi:hypothetical protein
MYNIQLHSTGLRLGSRFELHPAMHKAHGFLAANVNKLCSGTEGVTSVWKWLLLAGELRLTSCMPAVIKRLVAIDKFGCTSLQTPRGCLHQFCSSL